MAAITDHSRTTAVEPCVPARPSHARVVDEFLTAAAQGPASLMVDGEAGIGKTTCWLDALAQARERGFLVLAAQTADAESALAYAGLADLLGGIEEQASELPDPQRRALTSVLSNSAGDARGGDWRVLAAAFLALIERLSQPAPVLIAVDDLQWLDISTRQVLGYAARRLSSPVGVLATVLAGSEESEPASWLRLPRPDAGRRITIPPMGLSGLHELFLRRLHRSFTRPTMVRIHELSGGNPFFALELGRQAEREAVDPAYTPPASLIMRARARIDCLSAEVREVLLAAACADAPTVALIADAMGVDAAVVVGLLESAEAEGVVAIHCSRVRFTAPMLAHGVLADASPAQRREMHRRLCSVVDQPETRARHLALGSTTADEHTLRSLDEAAELAITRGAPAAAAELIDLAIDLGGDDPPRQIGSAQFHFQAGEPSHAKGFLNEAINSMPPGTSRCEAMHLLATIVLHHDGPPQAVSLLRNALDDAVSSLGLRVRLQVTLAYSGAHLGELDQAMRTAESAVNTAAWLEQPELICLTLGMRTMLSFLRGDGLDDAGLRRALEWDEPTVYVPLIFRPRVQQALLVAWTGGLEEGRVMMLDVRRGCLENGEESELIECAFHAALIETWLGNFAAGEQTAAEMLERATQNGGDYPRAQALIIGGLVSAYLGRKLESRSHIAEGLAASQRSGSQLLSDRAIGALIFLEVSLGDYAAAVSAIDLMCCRQDETFRQTEIITAAYIPDAVEALTAVGRLDEATRLVVRMETDGARFGRRWTMAVGARCRSLLHAAHGDVDAAIAEAQRALTYHDGLAMPFEKARTVLLLGELQRRRRMKDASAATLRAALGVFEELGTPLWADRARAALARADALRLRGDDRLTPSERRIADLVTKGMTNRAIAGALFISPKTVEANLARIYRKLNIRSRAELAWHVSQTPG